jgi:hypothetical protein
MNEKSKARKINLDVAGKSELRLVVTDTPGQHPRLTRADWAQAYLLA